MKIKKFVDNNLSIIPVDVDSKIASLPWKKFQKEFITQEQFDKSKSTGIAIVTGDISGKLLCIDFDNKLGNAEKTFAEWSRNKRVNRVFEKYEELDSPILLEKTQSGGFHVIFRCESDSFKNDVFAKETKDGIDYALIETRGEGGYFVCDPSPGYKLVQGSWSNIPELKSDETENLIIEAKYLDESGKIETKSKMESKVKEILETDTRDIDIDPDVVRGLLIDNGWKYSHSDDTNEYYKRPGKSDPGHSASYNGEVFYVFSSNVENFEPSTGYSNFSVYSIIKNNGDTRKSLKDLKLLKTPKNTKPKIKSPSPPKNAFSNTLNRLHDNNKRLVLHPIVKFRNKKLIHENDLVIIHGQTGQNKSRLAAQMLAGMLSGNKNPSEHENLGFSFNYDNFDPSDYGFIYFDTERNIKQKDGLLGGQFMTFIDNVKYFSNYSPILFESFYPFAPQDIERETNEDKKDYILELIQTYITDTNKHAIVFIDNMSDLVSDENSLKESKKLLEQLNNFTVENNCTIIMIMHENPKRSHDEFTKIMGNLGSVGNRKSSLSIQISKLQPKKKQADFEPTTIIYTMKTSKTRDIAPIPSVPFKSEEVYDEERGEYHVGCFPPTIDELNEYDADNKKLSKEDIAKYFKDIVYQVGVKHDYTIRETHEALAEYFEVSLRTIMRNMEEILLSPSTYFKGYKVSKVSVPGQKNTKKYLMERE